MNTQNNNTGLDVTQLRSCLLVAAEISRAGGQHYKREGEQIFKQEDGATYTEWVTKKVVQDQKELNEANSLVSKCKYKLRHLGRHIPVGVVVATEKRDTLQEFKNEWSARIAEFNADSKYSKLRFTLWVFDIDDENRQNLEQVLDDLRGGLAELEDAYKTSNPETIREMVRRMQGFTELLPERVAMTLDNAIKAAKARARKVRSAEKRVQRVQAKIAEELGPEGDVEQTLETLSTQPLTTELRTRISRLTTLADAAITATDGLENLKTQVDATPIRLARFAVQPPPVANTEEQTDRSAELLAARLAARPGVVPQVGVEVMNRDQDDRELPRP